MSTNCLKIVLGICIIIAVIDLIIQNDWNTLIKNPQKFVGKQHALKSSNDFWNSIFGFANQKQMSSPSTNLKARIKQIIEHKWNENIKHPFDENNLHQLINSRLSTFNSNDSKTNYTYEHVDKNYDGPIVEGWPPSKSRNVSDYISTQPALNELNNNCSHDSINYNLLQIDGDLDLLIMQHSAPEHFEARESSRNTWMKLLKAHPNVRVIFLIGVWVGATKVSGSVVSDSVKLKKEMNDYCDILQVNYEEHANNNTLKTLHAMKYLIENANGSLSNLPKFIMKTDDDIYVNIPNLMQLLNKNFHESLEKNNDAIFGSTGVLLDVVRPTKEEMESKDNQILSYIVSPYYMYDQEYYPQFLSGSGYIFSRNNFACLYAGALTLPYFHIEDVFMTGIVAEKCNIKRVNIPSFHPAAIDHTQVSPEDILLHYITPEEKYKIHSVVIFQHFLQTIHNQRSENPRKI